uniref:Uncharacterized protein n=1 Tax=Rhizophora mucronata TaxID=61149 RepID=A0A2P2IKS8_RHIMU
MLACFPLFLLQSFAQFFILQIVPTHGSALVIEHNYQKRSVR